MQDNQNQEVNQDELTVETEESSNSEETAKDIRKQIEANYQAKLKEIEAEKLEKEAKIKELEEKINSKSKTDEELLEELKKQNEKVQAEFQSFKKTSEVETKLIELGVNPELKNLIVKQAVETYNDEVNLEDVINNIQTQYPSAFQPAQARSANVGLSITNASSSTITREKALEMVNDPILYQKHKAEIAKALGEE